MGIKGTIPLIPNSMSLSLQDDILQFMVEIKFILLFIEKPFLVLSTSNFDYISEETIDDVRKGRKTSTNINCEQNNIKNIEALASDDFETLLSYCEPVHFEMTSSSAKNRDYYDDYFRDVEHIFKVLGVKGAGNVGLLFSDFDSLVSKFPKNYLYLKTLISLYLNMYRLLELLKVCKETNSSMVWSNDNDKFIFDMYTKYHITSKKILSISPLKINQLLGAGLLKETFNMEVVNIATVPTQEIVDFRTRNKDLLNNFLISYRDFLLEIQSEPDK